MALPNLAPTQWEDEPSKATPLSAAALKAAEQRIIVRADAVGADTLQTSRQDLAAHEADGVAVHGISNTANLAYKAEVDAAQAAAQAHADTEVQAEAQLRASEDDAVGAAAAADATTKANAAQAAAIAAASTDATTKANAAKSGAEATADAALTAALETVVNGGESGITVPDIVTPSATAPAVFYVPPGAHSGRTVQRICDLAVAASPVTAVDVVLMPGTHVWDAQPAVRPENEYFRLRGSGDATVVQLTVATAFTLGAEGGGERLLDFRRTADYQTFRNIYVEDLVVDCDSISGFADAGHVVIGTQRFTTIQARINLENIYVRRVKTLNVPFSPAGDFGRGNVLLYVNHPDSNEATQTTITNVHIEDFDFQGGNVGVLVGSHVTNVVPATTKKQGNVFLDEIYIERGRHDMTASLSDSPQQFQYSANFQVGDRGFGDRCTLRDLVGLNAIDVGVEIDSMQRVVKDNIRITDCRGPSFLDVNYNDTMPHPEAQTIVTRNCHVDASGIPDGVETTASTTNGSPTITVASAAGLQEGQTVHGAGIPADTTIAVGGISGTTITLSNNATATADPVPLVFATWTPRGYMAGVYANSVGATSEMGHLSYVDCTFVKHGKTTMVKGQSIYLDGVLCRSVTFERFKCVMDQMAVSTATTGRKAAWIHPSSAESSGGRVLVTMRDPYIRLAGTMAGGELRPLGIGGVVSIDVTNPTYSLDLAGPAVTCVLLDLAGDTGSNLQGRVKGYRTEKLTNTAGWGFWGIRTEGSGTVTNLLIEDMDVSQFPQASGDLDKYIGFNTAAQALGTKVRGLRVGTNTSDHIVIAGSKTLRDWEKFAGVTANSSTVNVTLPAANRSLGQDSVFTVRDEGSGNTCTLLPNGSDTINGASSLVFSGGAVRVFSNGNSKWFTL